MCSAYCSRLEITLVQGRNRQIRRMLESIGCNVLSLHRTAFAGIRLRGVSAGNWAELSEAEMEIVTGAIRQQRQLEKQQQAELESRSEEKHCGISGRDSTGTGGYSRSGDIDRQQEGVTAQLFDEQ